MIFKFNKWQIYMKIGQKYIIKDGLIKLSQNNTQRTKTPYIFRKISEQNISVR